MSEIKTQRTLLASAARTVQTVCPQQFDKVQGSVRVYLTITAASGAGGLKVFIRGYDRFTGSAAKLNAGGAAAIVAVGVYVYELMEYASPPAGDVMETVGRALPCVWDVLVTVGDASSYTYSVNCEVMPC